MLNNNNFTRINIYKRENLELIPNYNIKYTKTYKSIGLCNQLFSIVNAILYHKNTFLIIDSFYLGYDTKKCAPISKIIDLVSTSFKVSQILNKEVFVP